MSLEAQLISAAALLVIPGSSARARHPGVHHLRVVRCNQRLAGRARPRVACIDGGHSMKVRFTSSLILFVVLTAGCGEILGEDFQGYRLRCANGLGAACGGSVGVGGAPNGVAGEASVGVAGTATGDAGSADASDPTKGSAGDGGSAGELAEPGIAGSPVVGAVGQGGSAATGNSAGSGGQVPTVGGAGSSGTAGSVDTAGSSGAGGYPPGACQPGAPVVEHCSTFEYISVPSVQGIAILSVEQFAGGFELFISARGSSLLAQQWNRSPPEQPEDWTSWLCFSSLPQPDRLAAHAMIDGILEVFATTLCGGLYRHSEELSTGWLLWVPVSLPSVGQAVTDVAISETADDTNVVYIADKGRVFARPRLGTEASSPYADWQEIPEFRTLRW